MWDAKVLAGLLLYVGRTPVGGVDAEGNSAELVNGFSTLSDSASCTIVQSRAKKLCPELGPEVASAPSRSRRYWRSVVVSLAFLAAVFRVARFRTLDQGNRLLLLRCRDCFREGLANLRLIGAQLR
jgi:hypothetical protein